MYPHHNLLSKLRAAWVLLAETRPTSLAWEDVRQAVSKQDIWESWFTYELEQKDFVSSSLPDYCASGVMRSPTMWLGIFVGG